MSSSSAKSEVAKFEADIAVRPPVIHWRLDPVRRVQVAWYVDDPYADGRPNGEKTACKYGHPFTDENTMLRATKRECRTCKNRAKSAWQAANPKVLTPEQRRRKTESERLRRQRRREESPLLAAARTEI